MAYPALLYDRRRVLPLAQHQQRRSPQSGIPPGMIDRQLKQRFAFAWAQAQGNFHQALSRVRSSSSKASLNPVPPDYLTVQCDAADLAAGPQGTLRDRNVLPADPIFAH